MKLKRYFRKLKRRLVREWHLITGRKSFRYLFKRGDFGDRVSGVRLYTIREYNHIWGIVFDPVPKLSGRSKLIP